jgi:hypothetical protein
MTLTPKHTIFIAVSNYLTDEINKQLRTELSKNKSITSKKFIEIIEKHFDFKILRDKPIIPEDIWLFNYLMYDNAKDQKLFDVGEKVNVSKGLRRTPLIRKYESKIIIPQLRALTEANMLIENLK